LKALCPQFDFVLYAEPFPEADYTDPDVKAMGFAPRHCLTADDLLNIDGGRAAVWAAPRSELALRQKTRRAVMEAAEKTRRAVMEAAVPTTTKDALNWEPTKVALNWGPTKVALSCATSTYLCLQLHLHLHFHLPCRPDPPARPRPAPSTGPLWR